MKLTLLALCFLTASFTCLGEELLVGTEDIEYLPYSSSTDGPTYIGFLRDLLDKFAADCGHTIVYRPYPVKRLMMDFLNGKVDFKIPDNKYWASDLRIGHAIYYSSPITTYVDGVLVSPENKGKPYEAMSSLVTVRGFTPFPFMQDIATDRITYHETISIGAVIQMVASKRSYGGFVNIAVAQKYMQDVMGKNDIVVYDDQLPKGISEISLSTTTKPEIIEQFNRWMNSNKSWISSLKQGYQIDDL